MRIDIITIFPEMLKDIFKYSILKRAADKKIIDLNIHNLRDYSNSNYKKIDDYPYGGEAGMVMMIEPIDKCIEKLKKERHYDEIIFMTPDAPVLTQKEANKLSCLQNIIILCGHYKGIDERVRQSIITKEISIGDYVLTGGELPASVLCDTIIRLIPGVLSDETSALSDSFQDNLLSYPVYTRPAEYKGMKVPEILMSGDHEKISVWQTEEAIKKTKELRPDLLDN